MNIDKVSARLAVALCGAGLLVATTLSGCVSEAAPPSSVSAGDRPTGDNGQPSFTEDTQATPRPTQQRGAPATARITEPVGPPVDSDVRDRIPVRAQAVLDPVKLSEMVAPVDGVTVSVESVERVKAEARGPGEIGGPAVSATISMVNQSGDPLDLSTVTVTAVDDEESPLTALSGDPATPFDGELPPASSIRAVYVFSLAGAEVPLTITVNLAADSPVAVFTGALSE